MIEGPLDVNCSLRADLGTDAVGNGVRLRNCGPRIVVAHSEGCNLRLLLPVRWDEKVDPDRSQLS